MAVRLRPQSSAWLAPTALAAQLTAQTGQIAGQGVAGLLGGIASGVGAYTQKREQRRVEGINERRYQDSLVRQDRDFGMREDAFKASQLMNQWEITEKLKSGLDVKIAASVDPITGKPDAALVKQRGDIDAGQGNLKAALDSIMQRRKAVDCGPEG